MSAPRILIVDDTAASLTLLGNVLEPQGYEILAVSNGQDALKLAARAKPDLVILDVMMPGLDGFSVCQSLKANAETRATPVIFITSKDETRSIVRGFQAGAVDYILKPFQAEEVVTRVKTHLNISRLSRELQQRNQELEGEIARRHEAERARDKADQKLSTLATREAQYWGLSGFVGESPHLRRILEDIERLQPFSRTSVLITGESGTGKELVARAIHHRSPRAQEPFIPVNCVAIPSDLVESLFFGHVKGAFTGANSDRKGYFELADGGTLFLDEIGDMPAALQAKLLRVLEDGEVTPVGATKPLRVDVRVLCATNADLKAKIARSEFRQDLYFRLARYTVMTPPLRERREDIALLASHFIHYFATEMGMTVPQVTSEAMALLNAHRFPGNVRELKNMMERALILSGGKSIRREHFQPMEISSAPAPETLASPAAAASPDVANLPLNLEAAEHALIQRALEQTGGNVAKAARLLNVNRSRIYRSFPHLAKSESL